MRKLKHIGIRPTGTLTLVDFKKKIYYEELGEEKYRLWNKRMLKSGCGLEIAVNKIKEMRGCIYCPRCDEWFNKEQWERVK